MKRLYTFVIVLLFTASWASSQIVTERCFHLDKVQFLQQRQDFWRSHTLFSTAARPLDMITGGYFNLTEGQYGYGLYIRSAPFSHHFAGITTVNGWRFGNGLALGAGVGYLGYNGGWLLPVYADGRYYLGRQKNKFFVMLSGGFLINFGDFSEESNLFANPGAGLTIPLAKNTHLSFAIGLMSQFDKNVFSKTGAGYRDSFVNMKLGLLFGK